MDYNLDELKNVCIKHGIKMVFLYGSKAKGNSNDQSDRGVFRKVCKR